MIELSEKAAEVLMSAQSRKDRPDLFLINRTLGYKTWATNGKRGAQPEVAELYRNGLVAEWFNPWCPPLYLTKEGRIEFEARRDKEIGLDR